jgi:hypothetical protein
MSQLSYGSWNFLFIFAKSKLLWIKFVSSSCVIFWALKRFPQKLIHVLQD